MKLRIIFFALLFIPSTLYAANLSDLYGSTPSDTPTATGTTYYVDDTGSNTADGSVSAPWATLSYACSQVSPGDTIRVKEGVYIDNSQCVLPVDVDIESDGNNLVTINVGISPYVLAQSSVPVVSGNNEISGIRFDGGDTETVAIRSAGRSNQYIHDCIFSNFTGSGISGGIQVYGKFGRDDVSGQFWEASCTGEETDTGTWCSNDPALSVSLFDTDWASNIRLENNEFRDAKAHIGTLKDTNIRNNVFINNGTYGVPRSCLGGTGIWFSGVELSDNEFYIEDQSDTIVAVELWELSDGCVVKDNWSDSCFRLRNSAFRTGHEMACKIIDNSFVANYEPTASKEALEMSDNIDGLLIRNNTFTGSAWSAGLAIHNSNAGGNQTSTNYIRKVHITNNLFSGMTNTNLAGALLVETTASIVDMDDVWVTGNLFVANDRGVAINEAAGTLDGVTVEFNEFRNHVDNAISIDGSGVGVVRINRNQSIDNAVWILDNIGGKYVENDVAPTAPGAAYYVDYTAGSDGNPGTEALPWKNCPGMPSWSGGPNPLQPGDTVYFDTADTWSGGGTDRLLGAVGGVTYDGSTWGTGTKATFVATSPFSEAVVNIRDDDESFETTVTGFEIDCNNVQTAGATINWPTSTMLTGAVKRLENLEIHSINQTTTQPAVYGIKVGAVGGNDTINVEVKDCYVHDLTSSGIVVYGAVKCSTCYIGNAVITGNTIGNLSAGVFYSGTGFLFKNQIHDSVCEYNTIYNCETNAVMVHDDGASGTNTNENLTIRNNEIYGGTAHGITVQTPSGCNNLQIYGNLIYQTGKDGVNFATTCGTGVTATVRNNSFYDNTWYAVGVHNSVTDVTLNNNILHSGTSGYPPVYAESGTIAAHTNNVYYRADAGTSLVSYGGTTYTAANLSSFEAQSSSSDPLYVNPTSDFSLDPASPAITLNAGAN